MPRPHLATAADLLNMVEAIRADAAREFGALSAAQLGWRPSAAEWSVAQCLEHLVTANLAYFRIFEAIRAGAKPTTFWERLPWLPSLWGRLLIGQLGPVYSRKMKAPRVFAPSFSAVDAAVVERFLAQQDRLADFLEAADELDAERRIMTSPASALVTYSVMDAFRIIVVHEQRHLLQAKRVIRLSLE